MPSGRLEVITGPMFSGKTEELIRRLIRYQIAGKTITVFSPEIDDRFTTENKIISHSGSSINCIKVPVNRDDFISRFGHSAFFEDTDVVAFDECQFFQRQWLIETIEELIKSGSIVIAAGLDQTFRRQPFGALPFLMAKAEKVDKLTAVCHSCGNDAYFSQRLIDGKPASFKGETVLIGGLETYEARCRNCFEEG